MGIRKMYEFVKASTDRGNAVRVDDRAIRFNKSGVFTTHDKGLANAINQALGYTKTGTRQVIMNTVDDEVPKSEGYKGFFTVPELPWHKKKHWWQRRR